MAIAIGSFLSPLSLRRLDETAAEFGKVGIACGVASWMLSIPVIHIVAYKIISESVNRYVGALFPDQSQRIEEAIQYYFPGIIQEDQELIKKIASVSLYILSQAVGWILGSYLMTLVGVQITLIQTGLLFVALPFFRVSVDQMIA